MLRATRALKPEGILRVINKFYRILGSVGSPNISEATTRSEQPREVNWHAMKAAIEAQKERERRTWELWALYGRR